MYGGRYVCMYVCIYVCMYIKYVYMRIKPSMMQRYKYLIFTIPVNHNVQELFQLFQIIPVSEISSYLAAILLFYQPCLLVIMIIYNTMILANTIISQNDIGYHYICYHSLLQ